MAYSDIIKCCEYCEKTFQVELFRADTARFCSRRCTSLGTRIERAYCEERRKEAARAACKARAMDPVTRKRKDKFFIQKDAARTRGIEWKLTFEEWGKIWEESGHWEERGQSSNQYCMARFGDKGPYSINNVKIITTRENLLERKANNGSMNGNSKLTEDDVRFIRANEGKIKRPELAKRFGIRHDHVRDIQKRRVWKHVE